MSQKHHFFYRFTVLTKSDKIPDFTAEAVVDDRRMKQYNNEAENWIGVTLFEFEGIEALGEPYDPRDWYKDQLKIVSNCTQCSELHVLQRIIGCKLEKFPNGTVMKLPVFDEYGFDGNDLMAFNYDTLQWIDKSPNAKEIKKDWDRHTERKQCLHQYLNDCMDWISTLNNTNNTLPDVHIFAKKASDDHSKLVLTCLATGFYPRDIEMYIRLEESILADQTSSGIRPNADETFQMRTSVEIDRNHKGSYDCFVIHSSLKKTLSTKWDGKCSNCETLRWLVITGGTIVASVLAFAVYWYIDKKKGSSESILALRRNHPNNYGAVSEQIPMSSAACADTSDEELSAD
ncbi:H-2 class I histocompatibility antigen, K-Q alpha chain-like [Onychostoma macrolepis]|uniref:H-2 class I histocompatibility antigen, K-Q alpha chain-like n=1 Tax=Onychostoma macrolepis TaxID=369639 RepID=UPI00272D196F|nr:H-2 class I histocompatibility antigen, K-Q alpha chain-like [Onychostoma macrolepis]